MITPDSSSRTERFVLFSGHNDRAVVTLCRYLRRAGLPFAIVAAGRDDVIHATDYRDAVICNRLDRTITLELMLGLGEGVEPVGEGTLIYCPTTEFINDFMLDHRAALVHAGWRICLPDASIYRRLTSKLDSQAIVQRLSGVQAPAEQDLRAARPPCVLKPRANLVDGRILYPLLCPDQATLDRAVAQLSADQWFAQDFVSGQSHYLCGYLARDGRSAWYWQDNLVQQPDGKSIVLARTGADPGLNADRLFDGLHALGYHGPFMMELIRDAAGRLHYIEINPRFWGPLQLALDACPQVLHLFALDHGAAATSLPAPHDGPHWYAWAFGARLPDCHRYPAASELGPLPANDALYLRHDVYAGADTAALHGRH